MFTPDAVLGRPSLMLLLLFIVHLPVGYDSDIASPFMHYAAVMLNGGSDMPIALRGLHLSHTYMQVM